LDGSVEKLSQKITPPLQLHEVGVLRNSLQQRITVHSHALMNAMHLDRAVDE
jgi:hypothetical protein